MYAIRGRCHFLLGVLLALAVLPTPSEGVVIDSVTAPDLKRPIDNRFYVFSISVDGKYNSADGAVSMHVEYWDEDVFRDDEIDLRPILMLPALGAGELGVPFSRTLEFAVGCTNGGIVFGPSGPAGNPTTGENPMDDGYFHFPGVSAGKNWGYNRVDCIEAGGLPESVNSRSLSQLPELIDPREVGEPAPVFLLLAGLAAGAFVRRIRWRAGPQRTSK